MNNSKLHGVIASKKELAILAVAAILLVALSFASSSKQKFTSAEVRFTDSSAQGLAIVPASCPSAPHYGGDCNVYVCTASVSCLNATTVHSVATNCTVQNTACPAGWTCGSGACVPPPPPSFQTFSASYTASSGVGGTESFTSTGHLTARPALVRAGDTVQVYWNVSNVASCSISSLAAGSTDTWTTASSGTEGVTSSPILGQTEFVMVCQSIPGATPASITESQTVNVIPSFQEL